MAMRLVKAFLLPIEITFTAHSTILNRVPDLTLSIPTAFEAHQ